MRTIQLTRIFETKNYRRRTWSNACRSIENTRRYSNTLCVLAHAQLEINGEFHLRLCGGYKGGRYELFGRCVLPLLQKFWIYWNVHCCTILLWRIENEWYSWKTFSWMTNCINYMKCFNWENSSIFTCFFKSNILYF